MKRKILCFFLAAMMLMSVGCEKVGEIFGGKPLQLISLNLSRGELTPEFSSDVFDYTVEVPNDCESIDLFPQVGKDINMNIDAPKKLSVGQNMITISLSKENSDETVTYHINARRLASDNCELSGLSIGDIELTPEFSADNLEYTLEVGNRVESLDIDATAVEPDAEIKIEGADGLELGENTVTVSVTSPSKLYSKQYTIAVTKIDDTPWWMKEIEKGNDKFLAITFDDGPSRHTRKLLDILDKNEIKATFFVVGERLNTYSDILKDEYERGHEVANHSWDHSYMRVAWSDDEKWENINKCNEAIREIIGVTPTTFRPPGGIWIKSVRQFHDMNVVYWDVDPEDWKYRDTDTVVRNIMNKYGNRKIILLHDLYETSVDAAAIVIPRLKDKGYQFVTVDEMLQIREYYRLLEEQQEQQAQQEQQESSRNEE